MGYDIIHDGIPTIYDDLRSVDSSSDCPFISQALVLSFGNFGNYEIPFETQNKQAASYLEDENLKNRLASLYETDRNVKKGFLKSSQNKGNVTEGIWKCENVPSENLPEMRAIFFIKKCPKKHKNNAAGFVGKKCLMRRNVLKDITEKVIQGNYIIKCSKCDRRLCDVLNVFKGINYESINKKNLSCSCPHKKLSSHSPRKNSIPLESIAKEFFMEIGNGTYKNGDELNVGTISEKLKFKKRRLYDVMEVLTGLGWIEHKGKDCPYIIKDKTKFKALCNNSLEVGEPLKEKQK